MKLAFADPPYLGCGASHYGYPEWDRPERHAALVTQLVSEYDGWVLSLHVPSLPVYLQFPEIVAGWNDTIRLGQWVKPFASFKPNVNPAYCYEPVLFTVGHRPFERTQPTVRDFCAANITLQKGLCGAKPEAFCRWVLDLLNADPAVDELHDLYPGTGIMGEVWDARRRSQEVIGDSRHPSLGDAVAVHDASSLHDGTRERGEVDEHR